jgi:hypothetical protein
LSIEKRRDVIEEMVGEKWDMAGWDLRKALGLFLKSNPPLFEWLQSSMVYRENGKLALRLRSLMQNYYSPKACMNHYHMAKGNYREYLHGETVWAKKYFYVLRPVLSCLWIERGWGVMPMAFSTLVERVVADEKLKADIDELLERKKQGQELDFVPRIPSISDYLDRQLERLTAEQQGSAIESDPAPLDQILVETLVQINGPLC